MLAVLGVAVFAGSWIVAGAAPAAVVQPFPPMLVSAGATYGYPRMVLGYYFGPPGSTWTFSAPIGSFAPSTVTSSAAGSLGTAFTLPVDAVTQTSVPVTVTQDAAPHASFTQMVRVTPPQLSQTANPDPWHVGVFGQYFAPAENVALAYSTSGFLPAAATSDPRFGSFSLTRAVTPGPRPISIQVTGIGATYGRTATGSIPILGTTLWTGQRLEPGFFGSTNPNPFRLASAAPGYYMESTDTGQLDIKHWTGSMDTAPTTWTSSRAPVIGASSLVMQTDGNLVLYAAGAAWWSTGTNGTGTQNRLVMQSDGNLVVYTQLNHPVWSSRAGLIRGPLGLRGFSTIATSRIGRTVHLSGTVRQYNQNGSLVASTGRLDYLQRSVAGKWQNVLVRTTDIGGHVAVAISQPRIFTYRWYTPRTTTAAAAVSATSRR
jgi:hypothetical protein